MRPTPFTQHCVMGLQGAVAQYAASQTRKKLGKTPSLVDALGSFYISTSPRCKYKIDLMETRGDSIYQCVVCLILSIQCCFYMYIVSLTRNLYASFNTYQFDVYFVK